MIVILLLLIYLPIGEGCTQCPGAPLIDTTMTALSLLTIATLNVRKAIWSTPMNLLDSIATDMVAKKINAVILTETKPLNLPLREDKKNPPERDWRNKLNQKKK